MQHIVQHVGLATCVKWSRLCSLPSAATSTADRNCTAGTNSLLTDTPASPAGSVHAACAAWCRASCTASAACCSHCCCCCEVMRDCCWGECCCLRSQGLAGAETWFKLLDGPANVDETVDHCKGGPTSHAQACLLCSWLVHCCNPSQHTPTAATPHLPRTLRCPSGQKSQQRRPTICLVRLRCAEQQVHQRCCFLAADPAGHVAAPCSHGCKVPSITCRLYNQTINCKGGLLHWDS